MLKLEKDMPPILTDEMEHEDNLIVLSKRDPAAFKPLYEKYFRQIILFVMRRVNDKALAKDITQQVFFKALLNISRFENKGFPFSSWLYRIAINESNQFFRKMNRVRWVALEQPQVDRLYEELTATDERYDWEQKLPEILGQLEPNELLLIELRFFEYKSFKEIGEMINTSELNAKARTYRTLRRMKKLFAS